MIFCTVYCSGSSELSAKSYREKLRFIKDDVL